MIGTALLLLASSLATLSEREMIHQLEEDISRSRIRQGTVESLDHATSSGKTGLSVAHGFAITNDLIMRSREIVVESLKGLGHGDFVEDEGLTAEQIAEIMPVLRVTDTLMAFRPPAALKDFWESQVSLTRQYGIYAAADDEYRPYYEFMLHSTNAVIQAHSGGGDPGPDPTAHPRYPRPYDPRGLLNTPLPEFDPATGVYRPAWLVDAARRLVEAFPNLIAGDPGSWISAVPVDFPWGGLIWDNVSTVVGELPESAAFNIGANLSQNSGIWIAICGYYTDYNTRQHRYGASPRAGEYTLGSSAIAPGITISSYVLVRDLEQVQVLCPGKFPDENSIKRALEEMVRYFYRLESFTIP